MVAAPPRGSRDQRLAGLVVGVAAVTVALPTTAAGPGRAAVAGAVLAALTAAAVGVRSAPALRALVFLDVVFAVFAAGSLGDWPPPLTAVLVCVLPLAALLGCGRTGWLRPAAPWLRRGHPDLATLALGAGTVVLAGVALTLWAVTVRPEPAPYLRALQGLPTWVGVAGVAGFALVNPLWEEALFRGVLLEELSRTWGVRAALAVQAIVFGAAHWAGFPSGWAGMGMAAAWGWPWGSSGSAAGASCCRTWCTCARTRRSGSWPSPCCARHRPAADGRRERPAQQPHRSCRDRRDSGGRGRRPGVQQPGDDTQDVGDLTARVLIVDQAAGTDELARHGQPYAGLLQHLSADVAQHRGERGVRTAARPCAATLSHATGLR